MTDRPDDEPIDPVAFAREFAQMCMNNWAEYKLPQEPLAAQFVLHGAIAMVALVGAPKCAADLREMADQIELGNMPVAGSS